MNVLEFIASIPNNAIGSAYYKAWDTLSRFYQPACSISGGSDSDVMLDIIHRLDEARKVRYFWLNTGLEYYATKRHLDYLQDKYSITIEKVNPVKSVPACVKEFGYPFISKFVSLRISQLQHHNFHFRDSSYDDDLRAFGNGCKSSVDWWHNKNSNIQRNIDYHRHLKAFLIAYPPNIPVSEKCCTYSKKKPADNFCRDNNIDLQIIGVRKAEGGIRAIGNNCLTYSEARGAIFRPIFWFSDNDKREYERMFHIKHSDCYSVYGLKRTGCAGCPFNFHLFTEQQLLKGYEDGLLKAANAVFRPVYDYTKLYREFCSRQGETLPLWEVSNV